MPNLRRAFHGALPQQALSRLGARLARLEAGPLTTAFIHWFVRHYGVVMDEAAEPDPGAYPSFNAFFTRALGDGARLLPPDAAAITSPVDGIVSAAGPIADGALFQAKGLDYSSAALLGDAQSAGHYRNGSFATIYLRPCDYHRIHTPLAGALQRIRHIRGRLWPVRPWAVEQIPGLFARNERLVLELDSNIGRYALVMVGALMVGGLETVVTGPIRRALGEPDSWNLEAAPRAFARGEEIGRFNFGSTVILLLPRDAVRLERALAPGAELRLGEKIGEERMPREDALSG